MKRSIIFVLIIASTMFLCSPTTFAQTQEQNNMMGRLGIGANMTMSGGMGLSARYWLTEIIALEGVFNYTSIDTNGMNNKYFAIAGRGMYSIFDYGKTHGCLGAGIALGTTETEANGVSNDDTFFGLEMFFLVENMFNDYFSISGQTGISYINSNDNSVLSVGTPSVIGLFGFHFYL